MTTRGWKFGLACLLAAAPVCSAGQVWFVEDDAEGAGGDGLSWGAAFVTVQEALAVASAGDEIWIAAGMYTPSDTDATASMVLVDGVALYGGFFGNETARDQRDPSANLTVLSGDMGRDDVESPINFNTSNSGHVLVASGVGPETILDGLTIEHGAYGPIGTPAGDPLMFGSGMYCVGGSPTINNCVFRFNYTAFASGGGAYFYDSHPTITNSTFDANYGHLSSGGAILLGGSSSAVVEDCAFTNNTLVFANSDGSGGAIYHHSTGPLEVRRCVFSGNTVRPFYSVGNDIGYGGGISSFSAPLLVEDSVFRSNTAPIGGGIVAWNEAHIVNCLFDANNAQARSGTIQELGGFGGGFCSYSAQARTALLENCTFVNNTGKEHGAVSGGWNSTSRLRNCLMWNNHTWNPEFIGYYRENIGGSFDIEYCLIPGIFGPPAEGEDPLEPDKTVGCVDAEPLFIGGGDYRLTSGSPAVDAGQNAAWTSTLTTDFDGLPRFVDDPDTADTGAGSAPVIDIGAHELQVAIACPPDLTGDGTLDFFDVQAFLNAFAVQDPAADFNSDGSFDFFDVLAFLQAFSGGCP